jgi:hypothetical protein
VLYFADSQYSDFNFIEIFFLLGISFPQKGGGIADHFDKYHLV